MPDNTPIRKLILTADDYGVEESINEGISLLARAGIIQSVEVLPNYGPNGSKSIAHTKQLLEETAPSNPNLELGVHLTITSGKPIKSTAGLLKILSNGHFVSARNTNSQAEPEAIYDELLAQVNVLKSEPDIWKKVTHLTNHHDALWFFPEYTDVYVKVAEDLQLPIRNPQVFPKWSEALYYKCFGPLNADWKEKNKSRKAYKLREKGQFALRDLTYRSTDYLDSSHYSLLQTILGSNPHSAAELYASRQKELKKVFERISKNKNGGLGNNLVEMLLHVRKGAVGNAEKKLSDAERINLGPDAFGTFDLPYYNGITTSYFDGRATEYMALFWAHDSGLLAELYDTHGVTKGSWQDATKKNLKKSP